MSFYTDPRTLLGVFAFLFFLMAVVWGVGMAQRLSIWRFLRETEQLQRYDDWRKEFNRKKMEGRKW